MAEHIANRVHDRGPMGDYSVVAVAAASLYMASHTTGVPRSLRQISRKLAIANLGVVGTNFPLTRAYSWLY